MPTTKFYPPITAILPVDALPNELGFIKTGLTNILSHIYFRDLQYSTNDRGDGGFYSLSIVSLKRLEIEIPGTGIFLILNPSHDPLSPDISEFPITLAYQWPILGYVRYFNLETFSFQPGDIFDLALRVVGVTPREAVERALSLFVVSASPIDTFVDDVNTLFGTSISHPAVGSTDPLGDVLEEIDSTAGINGAGAAVFALYLLDALSDSATRERIETFFTDFFDGESIEDYIKRLLTPKVNATLDVDLAIEFPRTVLEPLDAVGGEPITDPNVKTQLQFDLGQLYFSTERGIGFDEELEADLSHPSRIAGTGLGIDLERAKLDISRTRNIPEADADGRPADFIGVYIAEASISFPASWNHDPGSTGIVRGRDLIIGTGGFSGTLSLEAVTAGNPSPVVKLKFGDNFSVSLDAFSITLKQNAITASSIEGTLRIPGFKDVNGNPADIRIKVAIRGDGDFDVTAHEDDGFKEIRFGDIFSINLKSVFFGKKDDDFYLGVSGSIKFTHSLLSNIFKDAIEVEKLVIWSDGRFEIEGGTLPLPQNFRFPIGPVELSISALHFGSHQQEGPGGMRNYRYFGFDGGVDINPGGVDVRGKGIKFYYTVDDGPGKPADRYLEIKSIAIDLVIPGNASKDTATLLVSGFLSINGTSADPEYAGGVSFALPKVKIAGGAAMKYRPKAPAFIVDAFVELSTPILLGSTGLGIYGFRGLFGHRYVATKTAAGLTESDTWFQYYKAPPQEGVVVDKFETPDETKNYDNPFSIGAGVSLATVPDSGKTFSLKLFLLLSLPEVIYLEGKANILGERVGLTGDDPPFFAYLAISPQSVETGFGADYDLPKSSGAILDTYAEIQAAFFFQNSSAWYVNFGTQDKRISARILSLFNATAYVMLSASGIAAGAGVTFGFKKSYAGGMVKASVGVYIEVGGRISFERPQIGGFAMVGGHVDVFLLFMGFHISIDTSLSVEVPKPFIIQGSVHLCVGVTIGFWKFKKRIEKCFDVEFKWEKDPSANLTPVVPFDVAALSSRPPMNATNMLSGESFNVNYLGTSPVSGTSSLFNDSVLPLDSWVDMEFLKGLLPAATVDTRVGRLSGQAPANYIDYVPPAQVPRKVKHEYTIKAVEIMAWDGSNWVEYRPYQAMSVPDALAALNANPANYKDGFWQNNGSGFNKLRLLAETSLSYMQQGQPGWYIPEQFGITSATLFCRTKLRNGDCIRWITRPVGTVYPNGDWQQVNTVMYCVVGSDGTVINWNSPFGIPRSLLISNDAIVQFVLNKPCAELRLKLTTFAEGAIIRFYRRDWTGTSYVYNLVETRPLTALQLMAPVMYNNAAVPICKVEVDPVNADPVAIYALQVEIANLYRELYEEDLNADERAQLLARIRMLELELAALENKKCDQGRFNRDQLASDLAAVQAQIQACNSQLQALIAQQTTECRKWSDFEVLFRQCFPITPPPQGLMPCPVCLDHLQCWKNLPTHGQTGSANCQLIVNRIQTAINIFCNEYNALYRDLYACNSQLLAVLKNNCDDLGRQIDIKRKECQRLSDYAAALQNALAIISTTGPLRPPGGYSCATLIHELCFLSLEDYQFNITIPGQAAIESDYQNTVEAIQRMLTPIWRPDTKYSVRLQVSDRVNDGASTDFNFYFGFRTAGPVGYFHTDSHAGYVPSGKSPDEYMLTGLKGYIDYQRSYPNADGELIRAKPLFYEDARILLFFIKRYVYHFFGEWPAYNGLPAILGSEMQVVIKDPSEDISMLNPPPPLVTNTEIPQAVVGWESDDDPRIPEDIRTLLNLRNPELLNSNYEGGDCWVSGGDMIKPASVFTEITPQYLKPLKLYTAVVNNIYKGSIREVHRYVFQTSRYADFTTQVNSYHLDDGKGNQRDAIFRIAIPLTTADINLMYDIVSGNMSAPNAALAGTWADPFDRLIEAALKLEPLDAAVSTEFNIVRNATTNAVIAVWIRNPEPFNDPKLPDDVLKRSLRVMNGLVPNTSYEVLFSKDRSQAFVMHPSKVIPVVQMKFRFAYIEWNGSAYVDRTVVTTGFINMNY